MLDIKQHASVRPQDNIKRSGSAIFSPIPARGGEGGNIFPWREIYFPRKSNFPIGSCGSFYPVKCSPGRKMNRQTLKSAARRSVGNLRSEGSFSISRSAGENQSFRRIRCRKYSGNHLLGSITPCSMKSGKRSCYRIFEAYPAAGPSLRR